MSQDDVDADEIERILKITDPWRLGDPPENDVSWEDYDRAVGGDGDDVQG